MAGYLITLNDSNVMESIIKSGVYSTIMSSPIYHKWQQHHEGTFADYFSMKNGDRIFFFIDRKIYGCGKLVDIKSGHVSDCKFLNYVHANEPDGDKEYFDNEHHLIEGSASTNRCFCTFVPDPAFFKNGIDMDEALQNKDNPFRSIRTLWKLSFIKLDDDESDALYGVIMKKNELYLYDNSQKYLYDKGFHSSLCSYDLRPYTLHREALIKECKDERSRKLKHEMALEASLCEMLSGDSIEPFGKWDYISHQVVASPFKPVDYMDKMDIFGYRYIPGYRVKSKYIIAELKKDAATVDIVEQIMKYVDWVSNEYTNKDYSMIEAYIVAFDFSDEIRSLVKQHCIRNFTKGFRPSEFCVWDCIKMVKYEVVNNEIVFSVVPTE